jgi:hypothetical protein
MKKSKAVICMSCGKMHYCQSRKLALRPCRACQQQQRQFEIDRMERERTGDKNWLKLR